MLRTALIAGLAMLVSGCAPGEDYQTSDADPSASAVLKAYDGDNPISRNTIFTYLNGVNVGLGYANAALVQEGRAPLFCLPKDYSGTGEQDAMMVKNLVGEHPVLGNSPASAILLTALKQRYPCVGDDLSAPASVAPNHADQPTLTPQEARKQGYVPLDEYNANAQ
ncbi:MAG: hypothetical protein J7496_13640 [Novosphingobium sp.]|nr:hypothetical protein [Novosphingobium sp.]MBO9603540.1 hypothetical protein [Novosphingobium sp.]